MFKTHTQKKVPHCWLIFIPTFIFLLVPFCHCRGQDLLLYPRHEVPSLAPSPLPCSIDLERNKGIELNFSGLRLNYQKACLTAIRRTTCKTRAILCPQAPLRNMSCSALDTAQSCPIVYLPSPEAGPSPLETSLSRESPGQSFYKHCLHFARRVIIVCLLFQSAFQNLLLL